MAAFDCVMFIVRAASKFASGSALGLTLLAQLGNMALLYSLTALLNARSRRQGSRAAHQVGRGLLHGWLLARTAPCLFCAASHCCTFHFSVVDCTSVEPASPHMLC